MDGYAPRHFRPLARHFALKPGFENHAVDHDLLCHFLLPYFGLWFQLEIDLDIIAQIGRHLAASSLLDPDFDSNVLIVVFRAFDD